MAGSRRPGVVAISGESWRRVTGVVGGEGHEGQDSWAAPGAGSSSDRRPAGPASQLGAPPSPPSPPSWPSGLGGGPPAGPWLPPPPARRSKTGLVLALVAGSVIVVIAAVALLAVVLADDDSDGGEFADADPADAATVAVPDDYNDVEIGDVRVSLPPSWVSAGLDQGVDGLGARLAPDDPQLASDIDNRLRMLPRSALLIGYDVRDLQPQQFNTNVLVLELPDVLPDGADEKHAAIAAELEALDATVASVSYLTSAEGPVVRVRYQMRQQGIEVDFLQYWYSTSDGPYTLSVSSVRLDDYVEMADAMASSFDLDATS
jgi:hypothetical protein